MNILFDGNFLYWKTFSIWSTYYQKSKDAEENEQALIKALTEKESRQVLLRKIIIDMCATINRFNNVKRVAFVIDSYSWRYRFHPNYKYANTKARGAYYPQFIDMLNELEAYLRKKGFIVSRVMGAEGDDLLYIWSLYFAEVLEEELVIITGDSDIRQIITDKVSVFCNNSKSLKMFCTESKEVFWNEQMDTDVIVESIIPFNIVLYKVIMGDTSDNIPKLKNGFGKVSFEKFIEKITPYIIPDNDLVATAQWIAEMFCKYNNVPYEETLGKVFFNLQMTWLNLAVYNENNFLYENGQSLLKNMLDDVKEQKDTYKYNKSKFSLEEIYGLTIK